jgi:glycosyltransferase involved in cell wall biosynthesis
VCFVNGFGVARNAAAMDRLRALTTVDGVPLPNVEWRVHGWPNKLLTSVEVVLRAPKMEWMFGNVDVAFIPNLQFFSYRRSRIPFVLTMHDLSFERYPECLDVKGRWRHRLLYPRQTTRAARDIVTVSQYTKWDLETVYGVASAKIHVVYPGADHMVDAATRAPVIVSAKASGSLPKEYIAFVSTIEPRKNIETLLQAIEEVRKTHPTLELVVIGRPGWKSDRVIRRMQKLPYVHYMGYADEETKRAILSGAKAFVYPSLYEGFGFPPLEAQRLGVPVIAGAHSSLPEVIGNSALLVDVLDVDSIARGITTVISDEPLRAQIIQAGKANVKRFTWEASARALLQILTRV